MTMTRFLLLILLTFTLQLRSEENAPIYLAANESEALIAKEGQKVIVHGETSGSAKSSSGANFVNFKGADFFLVTFKSDLDQFEEGEPFELFEGKRIAVEGAISIYQDKPQIKLTSPGQVTVLEADEVFPPLMEKPDKVVAEKPPAKAMEKSEEAPVEEEPKRKPPVDASEFFD